MAAAMAIRHELLPLVRAKRPIELKPLALIGRFNHLTINDLSINPITTNKLARQSRCYPRAHP